ncbi:DUF4383 domain-containing protein [Umezawaea sp. Da 62-37]|uniref:DUF4383 domain-containing protein n=1 Tax=Umezawaea sp. Da 62-37 TaxID=3075927 RepID=UPI0037DCFBF8
MAQRHSASTTRDRSPLRTAVQVVAAVFLLVGVLGFIPGITTDYDSMSFASHHSDALLLGVVMIRLGLAFGQRVMTDPR